MFGRVIWDKVPECIFENFEITGVKQGNFKIFTNHEGDLSPNYPKSQYLIIFSWEVSEKILISFSAEHGRRDDCFYKIRNGYF